MGQGDSGLAEECEGLQPGLDCQGLPCSAINDAFLQAEPNCVWKSRSERLQHFGSDPPPLEADTAEGCIQRGQRTDERDRSRNI